MRKTNEKILILGVNGFIGHHLSKRILATTDWEVYGMDMHSRAHHRPDGQPALPFLRRRHHHQQGVDRIPRQEVRRVLPLVAIATPATYVKEPLRVFELDFEANLPIVRQCVKYGKRLIFPSTSEVYGMCRDDEFDPENSELVLGPINKQRWIYSCSKQLMDRVIWAYGMQAELDFTLFRPFNWIGAGLDYIHTAKEGSSRVVTQFLGHIVRGEHIKLVDGGTAEARLHLRRRRHRCADEDHREQGRHRHRQDLQHRQPGNNYSVRNSRQMMLELAMEYPEYSETAKKVKMVEDHLRRLLRQGLSGRAEPRAENRQHHARSGLEADRSPWRTRSSISSTPIAARSRKRALMD